jgi:hypothetical protein
MGVCHVYLVCHLFKLTVRMCDILTMTLFDDYPDLMATASAISIISGVSSPSYL